MILPIDNKYRVSADINGWAIQRKKGKNWESIKWYASLEYTIKELADLMLRTSDVKTLDEAIKEVKRITETLTKALTPKIDEKLIEQTVKAANKAV